jgi:hypothetical protein
MSWLDDLKKLAEKQKIPGLGDVGQVGGEVGSWFKKNAPTFERYADAPGQAALAPETLPGSAAPKSGFFSPYPNAFDIGKGVKNITGGGGGGGKKKAPAATDPPPPTGQVQPTQQSPDDVFTAGLGMFFSQYLAPMMSQINAQNQGLIGQYGQAMNSALSQQLPAGVASVMKPYLAQNEQLMALANNAGASQLTDQIPFQNMLNAIGSEGQGLQAAASALPAAAASQALSSGNSQAVGQMLANMGLGNSPVGAGILSLLSQPSVLSQLTQGGKGTGSGSTGTQQQSITPIQVLPGQTPTVSTGQTQQQPANNLANTAIAQQLAQAMLANQQPSAGTANSLAGAGYTP